MNYEQFLQFIRDPSWDSPFFKRLPKNDSGDRRSNQAGFVVVKALSPYFPTLSAAAADFRHPTVDRRLRVDMLLDGQPLGARVVRYQIQTWGGTRQEARITDGTQALLNQSHTGDLLLMQRSREQLDRYRFFMVRQTSPLFSRVEQLTGGRPWGAVFSDAPPITQKELSIAREEMLIEAKQPFVPIRENVVRQATSRRVIARDTAFRETVIHQYRKCCCVSGISLLTPDGFLEVEAAHVIPLNRGGADEPRNGLSLTGTLHWAFDRGLFGINSNRRVVIPRRVLAIPENRFLQQFQDVEISQARDAALAVAPEALTWHLEKIFALWQ
ncbi:MAG TPA: HNH endonuclease [Verrucomicrobiae bacterium]|nr:HNH endonuclease [Verrucomicrobiae bacterium]